MLLKLQIIILLLVGVQSIEKEQWARHVVLIFYTDEITLKKGETPPFELFYERIPNCFGTLLTDNHILTGATCVKNHPYLKQFGTRYWRAIKVYIFFSPCRYSDMFSLFLLSSYNKIKCDFVPR